MVKDYFFHVLDDFIINFIFFGFSAQANVFYFIF